MVSLVGATVRHAQDKELSCTPDTTWSKVAVSSKAVPDVAVARDTASGVYATVTGAGAAT